MSERHAHEHSHDDEFNDPTSNRAMRRRARFSRRHKPVFTSPNVWRDTSQLNELGMEIRFKRIAKRRGKGKTWVKRRMRLWREQQKQMRREMRAFLQQIEDQLNAAAEAENPNQEQNNDRERTESRDESES